MPALRPPPPDEPHAAVVAGERLVGEVLVGALRAILGERATLDLVDRSTIVPQEPSASHVIIDDSTNWRGWRARAPATGRTRHRRIVSRPRPAVA